MSASESYFWNAPRVRVSMVDEAMDVVTIDDLAMDVGDSGRRGDTEWREHWEVGLDNGWLRGGEMRGSSGGEDGGALSKACSSWYASSAKRNAWTSMHDTSGKIP